MTITYSLNVANTRLCGFAKLLFRWKGSIYKLLYREVLIFCALYYSLNLSYRFLLTSHQKIVFEKFCSYCQSFTKFIPLSFVLGFYVTIVVTRWWDQFKTIPWPDKAMMLTSNYLQGSDDRSRMMRRTIARYLVLLLTFTFQAVSSSVKKRFPTLDHLQEAGLLTKAERIAYEKVPEKHGKWWLPAQWCFCILSRARKEKRIKHDILLKQILDEVSDYRSCCGTIFSYDWISIPLVYTQTVTIATYTYFLASIMGRQYLNINPEKNVENDDFYIPVFTILEFFFYMGWLKVAEQLINPFGEDDDDFELNWMLDRNLFVGLYLADELYNQFPVLVKDLYWNEEEPTLPYTKSSVNLRSKAHLGSAINIFVDSDQAEFVPLEPIMEVEKDDYVLEDLTGGVSPDVDGFRFNYGIKVPDCDGVSVSTSGLQIPSHKFFNMLLGHSNENVNKLNEKNIYFNSKKDSKDSNETARSYASHMPTSGFLFPLRLPSFSKKIKNNNNESNNTSTNNSIRLMKSNRTSRKSSIKPNDSFTGISRISNEDANSLQSEAISFTNYKSSSIPFCKSSFRLRSSNEDQRSLINFEKMPDSNETNINSASSSLNSTTNIPSNMAQIQNSNMSISGNNSRFAIQNKYPQQNLPHQNLIQNLNFKLSQLEKLENNKKQEDNISILSNNQSQTSEENTSFPSRCNSRLSEVHVTIEENNPNLSQKEKEKNLNTKINSSNEKSTNNHKSETIEDNSNNLKEVITIETKTNEEEKLNENQTIYEKSKVSKTSNENLNSTKSELNLNKQNSKETIYESNSSHESFSPFQSNQSTVTSFADFLTKKVEENAKLDAKQ